MDLELVRRGLVPSRSRAEELVASGLVVVNGAPATKPARLVAPGDALELLQPRPFVSRAGEKLAAALEQFDVPVEGETALDAGASTGGFTQCLLEAGASRVVAVDVGHGQLDPGLRAHERVCALEATDVRHLDPERLADRVRLARPQWSVPDRFEVGLVTADLSFISLRSVVGPLLGLLALGGEVVLLVKPQFEVGRVAASRGRGVIRDPELWRSAVDGVSSAVESEGAAIMGVMDSPLAGRAGNREFLLHARKGG